VVYSKQLRPVLQTGAIVMDGIFSSETPDEDTGRREEGLAFISIHYILTLCL